MKDDEIFYPIGSKFIMVVKTQRRMEPEQLTNTRLQFASALNLDEKAIILINLELDEEFDIYEFNEASKSIKKI